MSAFWLQFQPSQVISIQCLFSLVLSFSFLFLGLEGTLAGNVS